jgi:hypothetical protein
MPGIFTDNAKEIRAAGLRFAQDMALLQRSVDPTSVLRRTLAAELCETGLQISVTESGSLIDLDLAQFGAYRFDAVNAGYAVMRSAISNELQQEAMRGPLLLHALAHRGVFVIHASGLLGTSGKALLFCAQSGVGKSTLARTAKGMGWQRLADDLLPVSLTTEGGVVTRPHLDQPKLTAAEQYPTDAPAQLPLAAFVELRRGPETRIRRLEGAEVLERVLRNTVATRVFARACLSAHLDFCAQVASAAGRGQLLVAELTVADRPEDIPGAVREALVLLQATLG